MPFFSAFVHNLSKSGNTLFRTTPNGNCLFSSASLSLVAGDTSLVNELRVMAAVELHLNTICPQHHALKSVYQKSPYVMGGKLFSSYRTLFKLGQGLWDSKTSDFDCSYEALVQKEALNICHNREGICIIFMYSITIISFTKLTSDICNNL